MKTISILIGNSDDKLTQVGWSEYVEDVKSQVSHISLETHFFGGSSNWETWQNACWVFVCEDKHIEGFLRAIKWLRKEYKQDSVAVGIFDTEFI